MAAGGGGVLQGEHHLFQVKGSPFRQRSGVHRLLRERVGVQMKEAWPQVGKG